MAPSNTDFRWVDFGRDVAKRGFAVGRLERRGSSASSLWMSTLWRISHDGKVVRRMESFGRTTAKRCRLRSRGPLILGTAIRYGTEQSDASTEDLRPPTGRKMTTPPMLRQVRRESRQLSDRKRSCHVGRNGPFKFAATPSSARVFTVGRRMRHRPPSKFESVVCRIRGPASERSRAT